MNIYIMTDLEGCCYANSFEQIVPEHRLYPFLTRVLTEEVNAAVGSLLEEGVQKIYVADGHGPGGLNLEYFDRRAHLITGRPFCIPWGMDVEHFDALFVIGQHGAAGIGGILSHTQSHNGVAQWRLNGQIIGELGTEALLAGCFDIPVVFLSGSEAACQEMRQINPKALTVSTKRAICDTFGVYYPLEEVLQNIRRGAKEALQVIDTSKPFKPSLPLELVIENTQAGKEGIVRLSRKPGVELLNETTVRITAPEALTLLKTVFG